MAKARHRRRRFRGARALTIVVVLACLAGLLLAVKSHLLAGSSGGTSPGGIPPPRGYTSQQMIFDDRFSGTSLDTSKWTTSLGAQGIVWDNNGHLPSPYSGPNTPDHHRQSAMFGPSQVSVDNGLKLTAKRNTNQYAGTYPWISGVVTTEGKFSLPTRRLVRPGEGQDARQSRRACGRPSGSCPESRGPARPTRSTATRAGSPAVGSPSTRTGTQSTSRTRERCRPSGTPGSMSPPATTSIGFRFIPGESITALLRREAGLAGVGIERRHHHRWEPYEIILQLEVAGPAAIGVAYRDDECHPVGEHGRRRGAGVLLMGRSRRS